MISDDELLDNLASWARDQVVLHGCQALDDRQAEAVGKLLMPAINREEYLYLREFANLAKRGMGPCMREDLAEILTKLLDEVPVADE